MKEHSVKSMAYVGYIFKVAPLQPFAEILVAELADLGFDSFVDTATGVEAYILEDLEKQINLEDLALFHNTELSISYVKKPIDNQNWNATWEQDFKPVLLADQCYIKAPFHDDLKGVPYSITILPNMTFGTGHHETTEMLVGYLLEEKLKGKKVLDMGCGTGILGILAKKRLASQVLFVDIDQRAVDNTLENAKMNHIEDYKVVQGTVSSLAQDNFDIVIANINRNILINDMLSYASFLTSGGVLYLSGFYREDLGVISDCATSEGFSFDSFKFKNDWVAARFVKS